MRYARCHNANRMTFDIRVDEITKLNSILMEKMDTRNQEAYFCTLALVGSRFHRNFKEQSQNRSSQVHITRVKRL
jgi:hypothetical protein